MINAIIIDDESKGRFALRQKLNDYCPGIQVTGEAADGLEGLKLIEVQQPEVVFLDIEMPGMDGFEMLKKLPQHNFHIIFTTAYDHYAIKAIKFAAFDYLLKPVDIEELRLAVERAQVQLPSNTRVKKLETLEQNLSSRPMLHKIAIPTLDGLLFFNVNDIIQLEAQSNYTSIHFVNHPKLLASRTLKDFEEMLPGDTFFRPHHSHLINLNYIKRYIKGDGGQIEMTDGSFATVARRKKIEFLKVINQ
jgi:two-component system LytT family response regulator